MKNELISATELIPDNFNSNEGTQRGDYLLEESFKKYGAGRSGLCDKNGKIIAGNHAWEKVAELGMPVRVIETNGDEWVVVKRVDLDLDTDKEAREMALLDNRTNELNLEWNEETLSALEEEGYELKDLGWSESELERFRTEVDEEEREKEAGEDLAKLKKKIEKMNYFIDSLEFEELREVKTELENLLYILEIKVAQIS